MRSVVFVCLGNICRSPTAEGIFRHLVDEAGLSEHVRIDSAGTGAWHTGERADRRARATALGHGIALESRARKITEDDYLSFDLMVAMDSSNVADLLEAAPAGSRAEIVLLRRFDGTAPPDAEVPDPYYEANDEGFERVFEMVTRACQGLLASVREAMT